LDHIMRHRSRIVVALAVAAIATMPSLAVSQTTTPRLAAEVTALADEYVARRLARFPESATLQGVAGANHAAVFDNSIAALRAWHRFEDDLLVRLDQIDPAPLRGHSAWITYGFLREALTSARGTRVCRAELWPANQMSGWHITYANLAGRQPVGTPGLRDAAVARARALSGYVRTELDNLRQGMGMGYTTPRRNVQLVLEQLNALLRMPAQELPFYSPAARDNDPRFAAAYTAALSEAVIPALRSYRDFLENEYLRAAREDIAVSAHPNGRACYAALIRSFTTLDRTPRQIYDAGVRAVAARDAEFLELGRRLTGMGELATLHRWLRTDASNRFSSRDEIMTFSTGAVARARSALPQWFGILPRADVVLEPIPEFRERTSFAQYVGPSEDGSRPGTYLVKLYQPGEQDRGEVEVTAYHETYPGHHLQIAIARERAAAHPIARTVGNSGFIEGWGRYAERLADEMGLYSSERNRLSLLARAGTGMVVDPGIHLLGWTRAEALAYVMARQMTAEDAAAYVDRIAVWPGQMTTYAAGELEILRLRDRARSALGGRFDIRRFHDRVLEDGSVTLAMLNEKIERWIADGGR
jgi:uncharacterized protein (DUF885 family)